MQKVIYFGRKKLLLTTEVLDEVQPSTTAIFHSIERHSIQGAIASLQNGITESAVFIYPDLAVLFEAVRSEFKVLQAAGGLVWSNENTILLIFRKGKWDLPKGKLDEGEDLETCAVREVMEETGLADVTIAKPLVVTYHTYHQDGEHILKESHWYLMKAPHTVELTPQTEEDIEQCIWVKSENLNPYLENMQHSVVDVLQVALPQLTQA